MDIYEDFTAKVLEAILNLGPTLDQDPACTFSLYEDASNGFLAAAIDTYNNSLLQAKRRVRRLTRDLQSARLLSDSVDLLPTFADSRNSRMMCFNPCFGQMKHLLYRNYYHQLVEEPLQTGQILERLLKVLEDIAASHIFDALKICSPFMIGISSWDSEDMWVVNIINWPSHTGPRV